MEGPARKEIQRIKLSTLAVEDHRSSTTSLPTQAEEPNRGLFSKFRSLVNQTLSGEQSLKKPENAESTEPSAHDYENIARSLGHDDLPFEPGDDDVDNHPSSGSMKP